MTSESLPELQLTVIVLLDGSKEIQWELETLVLEVLEVEEGGSLLSPPCSINEGVV
ncbi:MAG: hypothetical protein WCF23_05265 [Candidatus Nitrosopolaris sp.]